MKKTLTVMTLLAGAVSVYSQGSVNMSDYRNQGGPFSVLQVQVFTAQGTGVGTTVTDGAFSVTEVQGNNNNTYNVNGAGNTVYATGVPLGTGYDVGLLAADGTVAAGNYSALTAATLGSVINTWKNSSGANATSGNGNYGVWNTGTFATFAGNNTTVSMAIAAWANTGVDGAANTLAVAQADGYAWGVSAIVTATGVSTGDNTPGFLPSTLTDFSLGSPIAATPEPSTIALGVIGASALLFRRRK
jgi:hypothetical protein